MAAIDDQQIVLVDNGLPIMLTPVWSQAADDCSINCLVCLPTLNLEQLSPDSQEWISADPSVAQMTSENEIKFFTDLRGSSVDG